MKKRAIVAALLLCVALAGCGPETDTNDTPTPTGTSTDTNEDKNKAQTENNLVFVYNNVKIAVNQQADAVISALGSDYTYTESPSCAYVGMDKVYDYAGFSIYTYTEDGKTDKILTIELTDDSVSTPEGIIIGNTKDQVKAAYTATCTETDTTLTYVSGDTKLVFIFKNDRVTSIQYCTADN